ncbi:MAG TPA: glycosyltransferase family 2 protein [Candidatus Bathyarchaeia archaeon]|nr:glycosyltransferase family 2 protein [Candidatus Bathyarchaeia archaeon]
MKISVIIPTMNEPAIVDVLHDVRDALQQQSVEVIVVDKSKDETATRAASLGAKVIHQIGTGYGDAYITGFKQVSEDVETVVILDGDYTYDPYDIPKLLQLINEGADLVIGTRFPLTDERAMSRRNVLGNRILTALIRFLYHVRLSDSQSGMRAIKRSALDRLKLRSAHMPFASEMIIEAQKEGLTIAEVPISYRTRVGRPKLDPFRDAFSILFTSVRLVRDYNPIVIFLPIGLALMLLGLGYGVTILIEYLHTGVVTRLAAAILSVLLILTGLQITLFGLLADVILTNLRRR